MSTSVSAHINMSVPCLDNAIYAVLFGDHLKPVFEGFISHNASACPTPASSTNALNAQFPHSLTSGIVAVPTLSLWHGYHVVAFGRGQAFQMWFDDRFRPTVSHAAAVYMR